MVLEYQRDQARRELKDLEQSIVSARHSMSEEETAEMSMLGLSPKEVPPP